MVVGRVENGWWWWKVELCGRLKLAMKEMVKIRNVRDVVVRIMFANCDSDESRKG